MKARYGVPLMLGIAAVLSTAILYPEYQRQKAAAARLDYAMNQPHNPDRYRFPMCHSRDNEGWGMYKDKQYAWYVVRPGERPQRITGHWSQYRELSNLYCEES
jgi:hypothetical protein